VGTTGAPGAPAGAPGAAGLLQRAFSSTYYGVSWHKSSQRWAVQIRHDGKRIHVGYYNDEVSAARAYDEVRTAYPCAACVAPTRAGSAWLWPPPSPLSVRAAHIRCGPRRARHATSCRAVPCRAVPCRAVPCRVAPPPTLHLQSAKRLRGGDTKTNFGDDGSLRPAAVVKQAAAPLSPTKGPSRPRALSTSAPASGSSPMRASLPWQPAAAAAVLCKIVSDEVGCVGSLGSDGGAAGVRLPASSPPRPVPGSSLKRKAEVDHYFNVERMDQYRFLMQDRRRVAILAR
jgi:hypothetical protein